MSEAQEAKDIQLDVCSTAKEVKSFMDFFLSKKKKKKKKNLNRTLC
jgi:hypothetical protein